MPLARVLSKHGGTLVLTNKRLLFEPLKIRAVGAIGKSIALFAEEEASAALARLPGDRGQTS